MFLGNYVNDVRKRTEKKENRFQWKLMLIAVICCCCLTPFFTVLFLLFPDKKQKSISFFKLQFILLASIFGACKLAAKGQQVIRNRKTSSDSTTQPKKHMSPLGKQKVLFFPKLFRLLSLLLRFSPLLKSFLSLLSPHFSTDVQLGKSTTAKNLNFNKS